MVHDLLAEKKDAKGTGAGEYYILESPPPLFLQQIQRLSAVVKHWPKRCVILGAEGSQWPFTKG
eukprot:448905-Alexandrium_andersonii.AAC.1